MAASESTKSVDCFGRTFIVRQITANNGWEWEVLIQDVELPDEFIFADTVDDCDTEQEAIAAWHWVCNHNYKVENPS
jgi:hypothetical protein